MTVDKFIEGYNTAENKQKYILEHITTKYVPYIEKVTDCKNIVHACSYTNINDEEIYSKESTAEYMLYVLTLVKKYTDIEFDTEYNIVAFDKLSELNLINMIIANIPNNEYQLYKEILFMINDDIRNNDRNIISFIDKNMKIFQKLINDQVI